MSHSSGRQTRGQIRAVCLGYRVYHGGKPVKYSNTLGALYLQRSYRKKVDLQRLDNISTKVYIFFLHKTYNR